MKIEPWRSLRSKIVLVLLVSSVAVSLIVAWRVETKLNSHFDERRIQCSWRRLESLLQDVYRQYGSWMEALASPNFPALTADYCLPSFWSTPEGETARFVLTDAKGTVLAPTMQAAQTRSARWLREAFSVQVADEVVGYVRIEGDLRPTGPVRDTLAVFRRSFAYGQCGDAVLGVIGVCQR